MPVTAGAGRRGGRRPPSSPALAGLRAAGPDDPRPAAPLRRRRRRPRPPVPETAAPTPSATPTAERAYAVAGPGARAHRSAAGRGQGHGPGEPDPGEGRPRRLLRRGGRRRQRRDPVPAPGRPGPDPGLDPEAGHRGGRAVRARPGPHLPDHGGQSQGRRDRAGRGRRPLPDREVRGRHLPAPGVGGRPGQEHRRRPGQEPRPGRSRLGYDARLFAGPAWNPAWPGGYGDQVTPDLGPVGGRGPGRRSVDRAAGQGPGPRRRHGVRGGAAQERHTGHRADGDPGPDRAPRRSPRCRPPRWTGWSSRC